MTFSLIVKKYVFLKIRLAVVIKLINEQISVSYSEFVIGYAIQFTIPIISVTKSILNYRAL